MKIPFTAGLLAGGKSSRMGRDKAGIEFSGTPLWRHQLLTLRQCGAAEILISGHQGASYSDGDIPILPDSVGDSGPLAGVSSLLSAAAHPLVLILAIDLPYMTGIYLQRLHSCCAGGKGVVPEKAGYLEALAAFFPKKAENLAASMLRESDRSMQRFSRECAARSLVDIVQVNGADAPLFHSLNSPADLLNTAL